MKPFVEGPISIGWFESMIRKPRKLVTFVARGTFVPVTGGVCAVAEKPDPLSGDRHIDDNPERALLHPSDFAPLKARTDVVLSGSAHAPGGQPASAVSVVLGLGDWKKALVVVGDRQMEDGTIARISEPEPFKTMAISYERSFGGPGVAANPVGRGAVAEKNADARKVRILPNVETTESIRGNPAASRPPAGFGPIPWNWAVRLKKAGSYGGEWLEKHWPAFPPDLDPLFFNAAPADQQLPGYLQGGEPLHLENLVSGNPVLDTQLPKLRVRCFYAPLRGSYPEPNEVAMNCDTIAIDTDRNVVNLVWRGSIEFATEVPSEDDCVLFVTESLDEPPLGIDYYRLLLRHFYARAPRPKKPGEPEKKGAAPASPVEKAAPKAESPPAAVGPEITEHEEAPEPEEPLDPALAALLSAEPSSGAKVEKEEQGPAEILPALDISEDSEPETEPEVEGPVVPPPASPSPREMVAVAIARGQPLADSDLTGADLTRMMLAGHVFSGSNLSGARLCGSDLSSANLDGTILAGADLSGCRLVGASLAGADLTGAVLDEADLSGAILEDALFSQARLRRSRLSGVKASRAFFDEASLSGADLKEAVLIEANLTAARIQKATFDKADLTRAGLERAWGREVSFRNTNLTEVRAAGAVLSKSDFTQAFGPKSIWQKAGLAGSKFIGSDLRGAEFEKADLRACVFEAAELRQARMVSVDLRGAKAVDCGFFQTNLEKSDTRDALFVTSNLFGASFLDADAKGALFDRCNLKRAISPATR